MASAQSEKSAAGLPLLSSARSFKASNPTTPVVLWIGISSFVILYNKSILYNSRFPFPIFLTTWHLVFSAIATQILSRTTSLYHSRSLDISNDVYYKRIVPIAIFYSFSLVCNNQAYIYLNISFIQMLKATTPVAVFIISYFLGVETFRWDTLVNIWIIVFGVFIASFGEVNFSFKGVVCELVGIFFEALRLVLMNKLLHSPVSDKESESVPYNSKKKLQVMDPLVSLYHFAPVCAVTNLILFYLSSESSELTFKNLQNLGAITLLLNASAAFFLNVSVVFLIGKTSSLILTLCGILKDIVLVLISSLIWWTPISKLQVLGYLIALMGLFGYRFGKSPMVALFQAADSNGYRRYYSSLKFKQRKRITGIILSVSLLSALIFYLSPNLQIRGRVVDGAFEAMRGGVEVSETSGLGLGVDRY
ncbi:triose-phosphate transporter family-domain-containing protein [Lipomyces japonicus]|uniref:triose-phosphate transporter family-domain-containing protein n=1 Tax=Lipomyces japonicus TaxID=56871 RepID=UPI0034CEE2F9